MKLNTHMSSEHYEENGCIFDLDLANLLILIARFISYMKLV